MTGMTRAGGPPRTDVATITLTFEDGSFGVINYLANGHKAFPKERLEVFCAGRVLALDNFRTLRRFGWPGFSGMRSWRQDKGQGACVAAFVEAVKTGGACPHPVRGNSRGEPHCNRGGRTAPDERVGSSAPFPHGAPLAAGADLWPGCASGSPAGNRAPNRRRL